MRRALIALTLLAAIGAAPNHAAVITQMLGTADFANGRLELLSVKSTERGRNTGALYTNDFVELFNSGSARIQLYIPRSHDNPELLWIDDPEVIRDLIAVSAPVPGHIVAQEVQHCDAEVLEGAVALVVRGMPVHQPP